MRAEITFALIAVSINLLANPVSSQTLRFADDEVVLGASGHRKTTTYYRTGRQIEELFPTTIFLYKPHNGYSLRYNGCHFRLRPLRENSVNFNRIAYSGMNYSMHDPLNASGNVAGVCTWTADGAEVFLGGHQGQILFAINKRTTYTLGESADTAADWTVMQAVLQPRLGESLYRPKTAKLPDWLTPLAVIGGAALLKQLLCGDADLKTCAEPFR